MTSGALFFLYPGTVKIILVLLTIDAHFLSRGKYGVVFKCESKGTKEPHALKLMLKKGNKKEDVLREVDILKKISAHPGVLIIDDFIECTSEYILVTEL